MKIPFKALLAATALVALPGLALANDELLKLQQDPNQWVRESSVAELEESYRLATKGRNRADQSAAV